MRLLVCVILLLLPLFSLAQSELRDGDSITELELPNVYGQIVDMKKGADKGLCVIFTNHHCHYASLYLNRIAELSNQYGPKGIKFILVESQIESFKEPIESLQEFIKNNHIQTEYLIDITGKLARQFGAVSSPEAFLMKKENSQFHLVYSGSIDNNSRKPERASRRYLKNALDHVINDQELIRKKTKSIGCTIGKD